MTLKFFLLSTTLAWCSAAQAVPPAVIPMFPSKTVRTFDQDRGGTAGNPVPAGSFPMQVFEESPDGQRYRVKVGGRDAWVSKADVRPKENIDAREMCSTMVASVQAGATRNANEACRPNR